MVAGSETINTIYIMGKTVNTRDVNKKVSSRIHMIGDGDKSTHG